MTTTTLIAAADVLTAVLKDADTFGCGAMIRNEDGTYARLAPERIAIIDFARQVDLGFPDRPPIDDIAPPAPAVSPADDTEENMRRVGHAVMDRIAAHTKDAGGPLEDWTPAECPSEVIDYLVDMIESLRACGAEPVSQAAADVLAAVPDDLKDAIRRMGAIEWGATAAKPAEEHAADMLSTVTKTAECFAQTGNQQMHGCYLQGSEVVICHTGTSPNSPNHARLIVGLWNWFLAEIERLDRAAQAEREG